ELVEELHISVSVFTHDFGPIPGKLSSLYCRECNTRYYHNYYVEKKKSTRTYFDREFFDFIHVAQHVFIEARTLELFSTMMLHSWTSATNCARIYNEGLELKALSLSLPVAYSKSFSLTVNTVWDGVLLHWLLDDAKEHREYLRLVHDAASQAKRLQPALRARNFRMAGPGQEAWNHACEVCCWVDMLPDGEKTFVRADVTDGVNIGRPTCSVHDCDIPLDSPKHRYCSTHTAQDLLCVVTTCSELAEHGHRTCMLPDHRGLESYNEERQKAMFQLKNRLARLRVSQPCDAMPLDASTIDDGSSEENSNLVNDDEEILVDKNGVCDGDKAEDGNQTLRARFGRKRTHNEQLSVACCGVIRGRATFYGSEAPNGVRMFWKTLYPTRQSLPQVMFYDNNCRIAAMLNKDGDTYFSEIALPVDVFHFKTKHKESDEDCGRYCNPVRWPELMTPEGTWRFNSSAAEQANAWIGGYQSIVREMQADRYEFFLDEMIKRRNHNVIRDLKKKGKLIFNIPRNFLLREGSPEVVS
ncbi:hypothetical protein BJ912DRAFT_848103, partial [Pholiota molesta]